MNVEVEIGSMVSNYRVERLLGSGAMGTVYLAHDVHLERPVALKLLAAELARDERFRERFLRESRTAARLEHPAIVPIYAAGEAEGTLFLAMRYVEGSDLREHHQAAGAARSRPRRRIVEPGGRGAGRGARGRARPPGCQAGQYPGRPVGPRLSVRLRPGQAFVDGQQPDPRYRVRGHDRLHRARADPGRLGRRTGRRVRAGLRAVRGADRAAAVSPRQRSGRRVRPPQGAAAVADGDPAGAARLESTRSWRGRWRSTPPSATPPAPSWRGMPPSDWPAARSTRRPRASSRTPF